MKDKICTFFALFVVLCALTFGAQVIGEPTEEQRIATLRDNLAHARDQQEMMGNVLPEARQYFHGSADGIRIALFQIDQLYPPANRAQPHIPELPARPDRRQE